MDNQSTKIGTIVSINTPQISCQLSAIGFDFVFIDMEHGNVSDETIASIILSKKNSCKVLIRISTINEASIKHALDLGCDGIIAPKVESLKISIGEILCEMPRIFLIFFIASEKYAS